jgi:hypothetical protein
MTHDEAALRGKHFVRDHLRIIAVAYGKAVAKEYAWAMSREARRYLINEQSTIPPGAPVDPTNPAVSPTGSRASGESHSFPDAMP